ncbi:hypothetical protein OSB04_001037 [Centaurea solstitialis]|uniref:Reverse transcriptase Ty1/copia-type domain-containing protein n=1 Tax=Centaurea solstitialis TaxID=347529 RepID=A0AA38WUS8_9ASTR|nr:hypothetical protein OSB04_001037 [Centaurea solstitialis]
MVLKKGSTALQVWTDLETLFCDNKDARTMQLDNELRNLVMGDLSVHAYFMKIKGIADLLAKDARTMQLDNELRNLVMGDLSVHAYFMKIKGIADLLANLYPTSAVPDKHLVNYAINGLSSRFEAVANIIRYRSPLPSFLEVRSMLLMEEQRLSNHRPAPITSHVDHSSSSTVLNVNTNRGPGQGQRTDRRQQLHHQGQGRHRLPRLLRLAMAGSTFRRQPPAAPTSHETARTPHSRAAPNPSPTASSRPPPPPPPPTPHASHPMTTRAKSGIHKPTQRFNLHTTSVAPSSLKQARIRAWYHRFTQYALQLGFQHSRTDTSLFIYRSDHATAYLILYVDDIVLTASSSDCLRQSITHLSREFAMTDLGSLNFFMGILASMLNYKPARTPVETGHKLSADETPVHDPFLYRGLAGALQYLTFTRPDIAFAVQKVCLYMHDPGDNIVSWSSKRQGVVSRSNVEAEYRGVANTIAETIWIHNLQRELHCALTKATIVYCDNVSTIYMSSNLVLHVRVRVRIQNVRVLHVPSSSQYADIFTKGLPHSLFSDFKYSLNICTSDVQTAWGC